MTARHHQHHILRFSQFGSRSRKAHFWSLQGPNGPEHASLPAQPSDKWARNHSEQRYCRCLCLWLWPRAFGPLGLWRLTSVNSDCAEGSFSLILYVVSVSGALRVFTYCPIIIRHQKYVCTTQYNHYCVRTAVRTYRARTGYECSALLCPAPLEQTRFQATHSSHLAGSPAGSESRLVGRIADVNVKQARTASSLTAAAEHAYNPKTRSDKMGPPAVAALRFAPLLATV